MLYVILILSIDVMNVENIVVDIIPRARFFLFFDDVEFTFVRFSFSSSSSFPSNRRMLLKLLLNSSEASLLLTFSIDKRKLFSFQITFHHAFLHASVTSEVVAKDILSSLSIGFSPSSSSCNLGEGWEFTSCRWFTRALG